MGRWRRRNVERRISLEKALFSYHEDSEVDWDQDHLEIEERPEIKEESELFDGNEQETYEGRFNKYEN